ncbi:MAG: hypothetical protein ACTSQZ_09840, partial [Candidatus Thorarchaeota archaeon]
MIRGDNIEHTLLVVILFAALGASQLLVLDTFLDPEQLLTFVPLGIMFVFLLLLGILLPSYIE